MLLKTVLTTPSALYKKNITHLWMLICWKMKKKNHLYYVTQLAAFCCGVRRTHPHSVSVFSALYLQFCLFRLLLLAGSHSCCNNCAPATVCFQFPHPLGSWRAAQIGEA